MCSNQNRSGCILIARVRKQVGKELRLTLPNGSEARMRMYDLHSVSDAEREARLSTLCGTDLPVEVMAVYDLPPNFSYTQVREVQAPISLHSSEAVVRCAFEALDRRLSSSQSRVEAVEKSTGDLISGESELYRLHRVCVQEALKRVFSEKELSAMDYNRLAKTAIDMIDSSDDLIYTVTHLNGVPHERQSDH